MSESELNNQGDYISGAVGDDGKEVVVGKNINTTRTEDNRRKEVNPRQESTNSFTFANSDNQAFQLFQLLQDVRYQVLEVKTQQTQSTNNILDKLEGNNRRLSSLELRSDDQRKEIETLKERGRERDEILAAIKTKIDTPPVIIATAIKPLHFWLFLAIMVIVIVIIAVMGMYLVRGMG